MKVAAVSTLLVLAALVAAVGFAPEQRPGSDDVQKWEHKYLFSDELRGLLRQAGVEPRDKKGLDNREKELAMNLLGLDGWECCGYGIDWPDTGGYEIFVFKRPIPAK